MKKPLVTIRNWCVCTDSPIIYYSLLALSSIALGFFVAYVWIPLVQWLRSYM